MKFEIQYDVLYIKHVTSYRGTLSKYKNLFLDLLFFMVLNLQITTQYG